MLNKKCLVTHLVPKGIIFNELNGNGLVMDFESRKRFKIDLKKDLYHHITNNLIRFIFKFMVKPATDGENDDDGEEDRHSHRNIIS